MARLHDADEDWDDDYDEDTDETMPCPYCHRAIHDDSVRCPYCGNYLSEEDVPQKSKPLWLILAAIACLLIVLMWIVSGVR
jgi:predicted nucleic acid-binding Zn ribbon protein